MEKPIAELTRGDVITAFIQPDGTQLAMRGGPFEVEHVTSTGGDWEGAPQFKITSTKRSRAARYANGSTHVEVR